MKKKINKNNLKYMMIGLTGVLPLVAIPFLGFFPYNNSVTVNTVNTESFNTKREDVSPNDLNGLPKAEFQNAIYQDAFEKATYDPDSILVYSIYWFSVFHRFGLVSHILSVLSINPEQKIYLMETSGINDYSVLLEVDNNGNRLYPNVHIFEPAQGFDSTDSVWLLTNRFITPIDFFKKIYEENPGEPRIHAYFADWTIFNVIKNFFEGSNIPLLKKNIYDFWGLFNKFESLNLFADGTDATYFFRTDFYEMLTKAGIGEYVKFPESREAEYKEAANFRKEFLESQKKGEDISHRFLEKNNAIMYVASLMITKDFNNDNIYPKTRADGSEVNYHDSKFFFPTTEFIDDINRDGSTFLKTNNGDYMNPYNSYEADLLESFKYLDDKGFEQLLSILKANVNLKDPALTEGMENKLNVVYSGTLLNNPHVTSEQEKNIRKAELNNILALNVIVKHENPDKDVQIIYKGHPRDKTAIEIKKALEETARDLGLDPKIIEGIKIVDPLIPYELYLFSGIFDEDLSIGKEVKLYSNFSTILWFLYADDRVDDIVNISVTEEVKKRIENIYGLNSKIFNKKNEDGTPGTGNNKLITTNELLKRAEEILAGITK
ncbi:MAG: hypothetical protein ACRCUM_00500 [Mycoplasmoidaceae bacterium]